MAGCGKCAERAAALRARSNLNRPPMRAGAVRKPVSNAGSPQLRRTIDNGKKPGDSR